jgi:hypothetical protein
MAKAVYAGILAVLIAAAVSAGAEPWKSKPYTQWDEKDVMAVLEASPWAKANVPLTGTLNPIAPVTTGVDQDPSVGANGLSSTHVNPASASAPPQLGGGAPQGPATPSPRYSVFWASSRTIREASARRAVLKGLATPQAAAKLAAAEPDSYQILVNSPDMSIFEKRGEDAFKNAAFIELKKEKKKINPASVVFQRTSGKVVGVIFEFPKTDASGAALIPAGEKEVDFNLRVGDGSLRTAFDLKQMADMQGQDL